jgi:hypothetical protein
MLLPLWQSLHRAEALLTVLVLALLLVPPLVYLGPGWRARRSEIVDALSDDAVRLYFRQFFPTIDVPADDVTAFFEAHYDERYGRRHYVLPFVILTALAGSLITLSVRVAAGWPLAEGVPRDFRAVVVAAVAGAYSWVVVDMIGRCRRRELSPVDLYWSSLRFVVAVPLAFSFTTLLKEEAVVPVAYFLGTFPTRMLFTAGRRLVSRRLGLGEAGEEGKSELEKLQGVTPGMAERLQDEGVSTILQLAYWNPVDLAIRANLTFNFAVDLVSQALAWLYLEDALVTARRFSLRGAYEIYTTVYDLDEGDDEERAIARATLEGLAKAINLDANVLLGILEQIAYDPYTQFNYAIWGGNVDDEAEHADEVPG